MDSTNVHFLIPQWPIFYEDNHLLALYKPAGLLIQGDRTNDITLFELTKQWIKKRYVKSGNVFLGLVHRLDRPVAGVIVFCKTSKAAGRVTEQFRNGQVKKKYIAILEGLLPEKSGRMINHIERVRTSSRIVDAATDKSSEARLSFKLLETHKSLSLVEIDLETGKHHQIRSQFAHLGFPVLGDLRYGASGPMPMRQIALFAKELCILHPVQQTMLSFQSSFPKGWPWPGVYPSDTSPPWNWQEIQSQVTSLTNGI